MGVGKGTSRDEKEGRGIKKGGEKGGEGREVQCRPVKIPNASKPVFGQGFVPYPAEGACNAPPTTRRLGSPKFEVTPLA